MNTITYAGQPLLDAPGSCFVLPWGATPGHGTFDVDARSFTRIQSALAASGGFADLVMTSRPEGAAEATPVTLKGIYLVSAEPVITRPGDPGMQNVASWRLTLGDRRCALRMKTITGRWNILKPDRQKYFEDTANGSETAPFTWGAIAAKLGAALGVNLNVVGAPAGNPSGLVWDADSPLDLVDALLAAIGP